MNPQTPPAQVAVAFAGGEHTVGHAPQCAMLVCRSTQTPLHNVSPIAQPLTHVYTPPLSWQTGNVMTGQTLPHAPQFDAEDKSISQPSAGSPLQFAKFALHVKPQDTPLQVDVELAGGTHGAHDDVPQLATDVLSTHVPAHK